MKKFISYIIVIAFSAAISAGLTYNFMNNSGYRNISQTQWPKTEFTEKITEFIEGKITSVKANNYSTAIFFEEVTQENADKYVSLLGANNHNYPICIERDGMTAVFMYSADQKTFSITLFK